MEDEIAKRYYTIGEVAGLIGVNTSLLRFWEAEFSIIQPRKNRKGERQYTEKDIEQIRMIHQLVKEKGYTLQGAKDYIRIKTRQDAQKAALAQSLEKIRDFLTEIRNRMDQNENPVDQTNV